MSDLPKPTPPPPDALRQSRTVPAAPKIDIFKDPFNPPPEAAKVDPVEETRDDEEAGKKPQRKPESGLAEFDAPHAFASVLASGVGRAGGLVFICMAAYGLTDACYRVSLLIEGWRQGGFGGFVSAVFAVPGSVFVAPGNWFRSLGAGILEPLGVPYLMLCVSGLIIAVRSEIHIARLLLVYALLSCVHAAAYLKMKNPISFLLWLGVVGGFIWLYFWYWRQQLQIEEEPSTDDM